VVLGGPDYKEIAGWRDRMLARMAENPGILDADSDYKETRPQLRVEINFERAADLGVSTEEIGTTLETMMGSRRVTTFVEDGEEYDVVLQARPDDRAAPANLENLYVRSTRSGQLVPLSSLVTLSEIAEPGTLNRFNRLRAITISANLAEGYTLGEAIRWMQETAAAELPEVAQLDYKGQSREFMTAGGAVLFTFAMALLIVYLVLAAQFESFIHPLVIMLTVPLAVLGALIGLAVSGGTLNLFSQIGIVMLVGLAAKNGILIVDFANHRRGHRRGGRRAPAPDPHDLDRDDGGRGAAGRRRRPGICEPLDHRCGRDLRRGVLDPAFALRRAFLLRAARALHALARGPFEAHGGPRAADAGAHRTRLIPPLRRRRCQDGT
jgi:multidrug efflux pump